MAASITEKEILYIRGFTGNNPLPGNVLHTFTRQPGLCTAFGLVVIPVLDINKAPDQERGNLIFPRAEVIQQKSPPETGGPLNHNSEPIGISQGFRE